MFIDWIFLGKIALSGLLGGILGMERDLNGRPAGLRTNMLISMASCLFTILSIEGFNSFGGVLEPTHVAAQIVTGVGFLGAGALIHNQDRILGLTTAADIWIVAAIGMTVGLGFYVNAIVVTVITVIGLFAFAPFSHWLERKGQERLARNNILVAEEK